MSRPLERALLRQRGSKVVWVIVDVGLRPTGRPVCVHNTLLGHPPQGHLALNHSVLSLLRTGLCCVRSWALFQYLKTFLPHSHCSSALNSRPIPLQRRTLKPSSVAMRSTSKGCPRWKGMPEPRSSRPHLPCSLVLKTTSDVSSLGLKCRAASAPCSSLHSRFIWNLSGTVGLRDQHPPCAGLCGSPGTPTQSPCVYSQDPVPDAGAVLAFWCDGWPAVPDYRNPTPDEQGQ